MSAYSVKCDCGASHHVTATQAGSAIACSCGKSVNVPTLTLLRRSVGETAAPLNTIELIRAMIRDGTLPDGKICPYSRRPANDTILFNVECERSSVRGGEPLDMGKMVTYVFLFGWIGALIASRKSQPREEFGRDTSVTIPVRISSDVRDKIVRLRRQRKLKSLVSETPLYARLLHEYPAARVTVQR
jgi:hypothetical protein